MKTKLLTMLKMQETLNSGTAGKDWKDGIASNGKDIDWDLEIILEVAELVESTPHKHWKDTSHVVDLENVQIELVDIWHFLLSKYLRIFSAESIANMVMDKEVAFVAEHAGVGFVEEDYNQKMLVIMAKAVIREVLEVSPNGKLLKSFFTLCDSAGLTFEELYVLYIGKNILNKFRQANGYKEGTYVKIWGIVEDNVVMKNLIELNPNTSGDELYKMLEQAYKCWSN